MDASVSELAARPTARTTNRWAMASAFVATAALPLWAFFALSTVTWQNPLTGDAAFNLLSAQAIRFIRANSLELGIVITVVGLIVPLALLAIALVIGPTENESRSHGWLRIALVACGLLVALFLVALLPLVGV